MRDQIGLPATFTLDACRHGGMTELGEAEPTDGQGRALSGHKTRQAYAGLRESHDERALRGHPQRSARLQAGEHAKNIIQNEQRNGIENENRYGRCHKY